VAFHDPGFDVVARGEREQLALAGDLYVRRERGAHEKRALLPMPAQEPCRRQAAEQSRHHRGDYPARAPCQSKKVLA
jgi:hypothetical protein